MHLNFHFLVTQLCVIPILIRQNQGYVLLAANMDDFKSIARKFVPETLVNQLAELASKSPASNDYPKFKHGPSSESEEDEEEIELPAIRRDKEAPRLTKINFEQLVEKVKERLRIDMMTQQSNPAKATSSLQTRGVTRNKYARELINSENNKNIQSLTTNSPQKVTLKKPRKVIVNKQQKAIVKKQEAVKENSQYDDYNFKNPDEIYRLIHDVHAKPKKSAKVNDDGMPYAKIDMMKQDSYDEYVMPAKEDKIFDSAPVENEMKIRKTVNPNNVKRIKKINVPPTTTTEKVEKLSEVDIIVADEDLPIEDIKDYREYVGGGQSQEMKAKTENLWFDYNNTNTNDYIDNTTPIGATKKKQGTMFPKRDYYKMSSPNYAAKVPIVAEGYNFDEPLPEKDREPENLERLLPMPPSIINGKVRFSK